MASFIGGNSGTPIKGTNTNDSAAAGNVGEVISSANTTVAIPTSTQYGDFTHIDLTAGDWMVSFNAENIGASSTLTTFEIGISTTTGNSSAGLTGGDNDLAATLTAGTTTSLTIANYRMSLSGATTVYAKMRGVFSGGTNTVNGRITAVRIR